MLVNGVWTMGRPYEPLWSIFLHLKMWLGSHFKHSKWCFLRLSQGHREADCDLTRFKPGTSHSGVHTLRQCHYTTTLVLGIGPWTTLLLPSKCERQHIMNKYRHRMLSLVAVVISMNIWQQIHCIFVPLWWSYQPCQSLTVHCTVIYKI
jgi:hypothetical protein